MWDMHDQRLPMTRCARLLQDCGRGRAVRYQQISVEGNPTSSKFLTVKTEPFTFLQPGKGSILRVALRLLALVNPSRNTAEVLNGQAADCFLDFVDTAHVQSLASGCLRRNQVGNERLASFFD